MAPNNNSNSIHLIRLYHAPINVVWDAYTDPEQAAQWWGPRGFTITNHSKELRVGGIWHYTMHSADGVDFPNKTKYLEIDPGKRLVYDHGGNDEQAPMFRVTVLFSESHGKTKMDMTMTLPTPEAAQKTREFIKKAGGDSTWDRLDEYLAKRMSNKDIFCINRSFATPIEKMFEMWINPQKIMSWLAPTGSEMEFRTSDIREGGNSFYMMSNGADLKLFGRTQYLEIKRPHHLVYTQQFCDENENISRHPLAPTWPETMLTTVDFDEEAADQTRVTVRWECHGQTSAQELATFVNARAGMTQGWTGSFDKLEEALINHV